MLIEFTNRLNKEMRLKCNPQEPTKLINFLNQNSRFRPKASGVTNDSKVYQVGPELRIETPAGYKYYQILSDCSDFDYEV